MLDECLSSWCLYSQVSFFFSEKLAGELVIMFVSELALKVENRTIILSLS
jgi:hypothetical protein